VLISVINSSGLKLRENHSGMETCLVEQFSVFFCCVRTIVVWKRAKSYLLIKSGNGGLRENHSGMETKIFLYEHYNPDWQVA